MVARYLLLAPFMNGTKRYEKGQEIDFSGVPNLFMKPLNAEAETAKDVRRSEQLENRKPYGQWSLAHAKREAGEYE